MEKPRDVVKLRRWCIRRRGEGVPVSDICAAAQIPRKTFYNWLNLYRQHGSEGLKPGSRRPHVIHRTPTDVVEKAISIRQETNWCPHKIAGHLRLQGLPVGHMTVYRILCQSNLNKPLQKPRVKRSYIRWERKHSNTLWQCDLKIVGSEWLVTILDDHSRYVTGSEVFKEGTAENVIWLLDQAIHEYSKPKEILTDHGSQFYSVRHGESSFARFCSEIDIAHILGGIGRPTTLGKIERWFRTYDQEHARFQLHRKFIEYYNWKRPHMSLKYNTPAQVYFRDVPNVLG
jgi:putative transposase